MSANIVNEYFALFNQGAVFEDQRLARLRERMTDADIRRTVAMLKLPVVDANRPQFDENAADHASKLRHLGRMRSATKPKRR